MFTDTNTYEPPTNFLFLEATFGRIAKAGDRCEVFGGALRDQILGVKEVDIDIKVTKRLYLAFFKEMKRQFRVVSRTWTCIEYSHTYTREVLVIDTPTQQNLILDITFFRDENDDTPLDHTDMVDFTVNNLTQSLIGEDKGKIRVRYYPFSTVRMSYTEWLTECIRDVISGRLRCIYDQAHSYQFHTFVKWHMDTFEYRSRRLSKMKMKDAFKDSEVEYLTPFRFDQNIVYGFDIKVDEVEEDVCPVCILTWDEISTKIVTLKCRHTFCVACMDKYLKSDNSSLCCPVCKTNIEA